MTRSTFLRRSLPAFAVALFTFAPLTQADVKLPSIFSDHMVLQQDRPKTVWGWADPGEEVTVTIEKATATAKAGDDGKWAVKLDRIPAGGPYTMHVKGKNELKVADVMVGEVWLCSGQSNMAMSVSRSNNFENEKAAATNGQIRMYTVARNPTTTPQDDAPGSWKVCSPETVGAFSATAYFFGRTIQPQLNVPVGLINSSVGGTDICAWTSEDAQLSVERLKAEIDQWKEKDQTFDPAKAEAAYQKQLAAWKEKVAKAKADGKPVTGRAPRKPDAGNADSNRPANLYNGMIVPVMPYTIRGAIWYQGERNSRTDETGKLYATQLALLIKDWRTRWGYDFPFAFVQLPNFERAGDGWALVRESMLKTVQSVPDTGMAITVDVGEAKDIHPKNKQAVGQRLANWALATVYGNKDIAAMGPIPAGHEVKDGEVVVTFKHAHGGLVAKGGDAVKGFVIAGADGKFVPATAKIDGDKVIVSSPEVAKPTAVKYAWESYPDCNLYNGADLPASPFRTDDK